MPLLVLGLHVHASGGHAVLPDFFGGQVQPWHLQAAQLCTELREVAAGVEERAKSHVAANARKAIKIGEFHGSTPPRGTVRPARKVSDGSISILSATLWGVKSWRATTPPPPTFPDLRNLKDLEGTPIGSAHSNGVTNLADKSHKKPRN